MTLGISTSIQNEQQRKKKDHLLYISDFFGWGKSPCDINISSFNSYYQNSKNQENNIKLVVVVTQTGEDALLCCAGSWDAA